VAERTPQTFANHTKFDPPFHFVLVPTLLVLSILTITNVIRHYDLLTAWILVVVMLALVNVSFRTRIYSLKVQNRLIRLEERLRLSSLLSEPLRSRIGDLTESQLVAIRFASDGEVASLVQKALTDNLKNADIKRAIVRWRADYYRV
jgi:cell division protein FtsL